MTMTVAQEVAALERLPIRVLQERYAEVFGEPTRAHNRAWLVKRIAWRLQARAEGDLSERARRRAAELADDAALRLSPPRGAAGPDPTPAVAIVPTARDRDPRLPPPGTLLTRRYKGRTLQVQVLHDGFAYQGQVYPSLSAVARAITGSHCNGFLFFGLTKGGDR